MTAGRVPWVAAAGLDPVFDLHYVPTVEDHIAVDYERGIVLPHAPFVGGFAVLGLFIGLASGYPSMKAGETGLFAAIVAGSFLGGLFLGWLLYGPLLRAVTASWRRSLAQLGAVDAPIQMAFGSFGIESSGRPVAISIRWDQLVGVEADSVRYFFWITPWQAVVVPVRTLGADDRRAEFDRWIATWYGAPPVSPPRMTRDRGKRAA